MPQVPLMNVMAAIFFCSSCERFMQSIQSASNQLDVLYELLHYRHYYDELEAATTALDLERYLLQRYTGCSMMYKLREHILEIIS